MEAIFSSNRTAVVHVAVLILRWLHRKFSARRLSPLKLQIFIAGNKVLCRSIMSKRLVWHFFITLPYPSVSRDPIQPRELAKRKLRNQLKRNELNSFPTWTAFTSHSFPHRRRIQLKLQWTKTFSGLSVERDYRDVLLCASNPGRVQKTFFSFRLNWAEKYFNWLRRSIISMLFCGPIIVKLSPAMGCNRQEITIHYSVKI